MDWDILIIDDEADIVRFVQRVLKRAGYRVRTAADAASARIAIADQRPDIVLLDWGLPDMSGELVFEHLYALDPDLPVIIMTGDPHSIRALNGAGIRRMLMKPFELTELLSMVARCAPCPRLM